MLRSTLHLRTTIQRTCAPLGMTAATDVAFYFPRFLPETHVRHFGIPEIKESVELLKTYGSRTSVAATQLENVSILSHHGGGGEEEMRSHNNSNNINTHYDRVRPNMLPRWGPLPEPVRYDPTDPETNAECKVFRQRSKARDKALLLMERGIDILENLGGVVPKETAAATASEGGGNNSNNTGSGDNNSNSNSNKNKTKKKKNNDVADMLRALYAMRFEVLTSPEHLPRAEYARHMHAPKSVLRDAAKLIYYHQKAHDFYQRREVVPGLPAADGDNDSSNVGGGSGGGHRSGSDAETNPFKTAKGVIRSPAEQAAAEAAAAVDVFSLDVSCVIVSNFIRAFCALHTKPFNAGSTAAKSSGGNNNNSNNKGGDAAAADPSKVKSSPLSSLKSTKKGGSSSSQSTSAGGVKDWKMEIAPGEFLTLEHVKRELEHLIDVSRRAVAQHGGAAQLARSHLATPSTEAVGVSELRWNVPKLLMLRAILEIPLSGNLSRAAEFLREATQTVYNFHKRGALILEGLRPQSLEPELGLFLLAETELQSRIFDYNDISVGENNAAVLRAYEHCAEFFATHFDTALDADGIMSAFANKNNNNNNSDKEAAAAAEEKRALMREENSFEALAYTLVMASYANFLLAAPRPPGTSTKTTPVFLPKQTFSLSPLLTVASARPLDIFTDTAAADVVSFPADVCRKKAGAALERALQINRGLMPHYKNNPAAAWTLLALGCLYADSRDYLYATGFFESASKCVADVYGGAASSGSNNSNSGGGGSSLASPAVGLEMLLLRRLRYEFLAGVGSEQEAQTAAHEVVAMLKRLDQLPF